MAFGDVLSTASNTASSITNPFAVSAGFTVAVGDLVVVIVAERVNVTAGNCTDGLGNTYTAASAPSSAGTDNGNATSRWYYSLITVAGTATPSVAATASTDDAVIIAVRFEGPFTASPLDANPSDVNDTTTPYTCPSTGTLSQADELIIALGSAVNGSTWTATAPNVIAKQDVSGGGGPNTIAAVIGSQVVAATTAVAPAFTYGTTPTATVMGTASFKKAAADSPVVTAVYQADMESLTRTIGVMRY